MYSCGKLAFSVLALSLRYNFGCYIWRYAGIL